MAQKRRQAEAQEPVAPEALPDSQGDASAAAANAPTVEQMEAERDRQTAPVNSPEVPHATRDGDSARKG